MRKKFKIGPELNLELNRSLRDLEYNVYSNPVGMQDLDSRKMLDLISRRIRELRERGYPQDWIEKDVERLMGEL